jgi:glutathione peroxidase
MRMPAVLLAAVLVLALSQFAAAAASSVHEFKMKDIDGKEVDLSTYKGKTLLIVNVASFCGNTKQYKQLQELHEKYADKGLVILGFPANEFGKQEPGSDADIKEFCTSKYKVSFPMFSKIVVKGDGQHPLYQYLTSADANPKTAGPVAWNFAKFLVDKDGKVIARFAPALAPDHKSVVEAIEANLPK